MSVYSKNFSMRPVICLSGVSAFLKDTQFSPPAVKIVQEWIKPESVQKIKDNLHYRMDVFRVSSRRSMEQLFSDPCDGFTALQEQLDFSHWFSNELLTKVSRNEEKATAYILRKLKQFPGLAQPKHLARLEKMALYYLQLDRTIMPILQVLEDIDCHHQKAEISLAAFNLHENLRVAIRQSADHMAFCWNDADPYRLWNALRKDLKSKAYDRALYKIRVLSKKHPVEDNFYAMLRYPHPFVRMEAYKILQTQWDAEERDLHNQWDVYESRAVSFNWQEYQKSQDRSLGMAILDNLMLFSAYKISEALVWLYRLSRDLKDPYLSRFLNSFLKDIESND